MPADAPQGLCPNCVLKVGFGTQPTGNGAGSEADAASSGSASSRFVPPTPEELAPYFPDLEILELIGRGGMGVVYKARQKRLDRLVALKILAPKIGQDPAFADRFAREARAMAMLNHPHIVAVHDFGQTESAPLYYFFMEYVDGLSLRRLLDSGKLAPETALAIVPQICEALQYAHDQGVVHRDIKPENILLDKRGRVKIADFGIAKLVKKEEESPAVADSDSSAVATGSLTSAGQVLGTPQYMAPEQIEHPLQVDHRADIYSLGVVFYQMLTGELPVGHFAPPSRKVQIDVRLDEVVLRALDKEPERRYQQANEIKTQVETIATTAGSQRHGHGLAFLVEFLGRGGKAFRAMAEANPLPVMDFWQALEAGDYVRAWEKAAPYFQRDIGKDDWVDLMEKVRRPLGKAVSRRQQSTSFINPGRRFTQTLISGFDSQQWATETCTASLQPDGEWRVEKYDISPPAQGDPPQAAGAPVSSVGAASARLSATAIVGAIWAALFLPAMFAAMILYDERYYGTAAVLLFVGLTPILGTTVLGCVALSQIRHSAGRLFGLRLALFDALLFPLLAMNGMMILIPVQHARTVAIREQMSKWEGAFQEEVARRDAAKEEEAVKRKSEKRSPGETLEINPETLLKLPPRVAVPISTGNWALILAAALLAVAIDSLIVRSAWRAASRSVRGASLPIDAPDRQSVTAAIHYGQWASVQVPVALVGFGLLVWAWDVRPPWVTWLAWPVAATVVMGLILLLLSLPLMLRMIPPGRAYGLRIRESCASPELWYAINARGGRTLALFSMLVVGAGLAGLFTLPLHQPAYPWAALATVVLCILVPWLDTVRWAKVAAVRGPRKHGWRLVDVLLSLVVAVLLAAFVLGFVMQAYDVTGDAVSPELPKHSRALAWKLAGDIRPGDIIVYPSGDENRLGRVVRAAAEPQGGALFVVVSRNDKPDETVPLSSINGKIVLSGQIVPSAVPAAGARVGTIDRGVAGDEWPDFSRLSGTSSINIGVGQATDVPADEPGSVEVLRFEGDDLPPQSIAIAERIAIATCDYTPGMTREQVAIEAGKGDAMVLGENLVAMRGSLVAPLALPQMNFTGKEEELYFILALRQITRAELIRQIEEQVRQNGATEVTLKEESVYVLVTAVGKLRFLEFLGWGENRSANFTVLAAGTLRGIARSTEASKTGRAPSDAPVAAKAIPPGAAVRFGKTIQITFKRSGRAIAQSGVEIADQQGLVFFSLEAGRARQSPFPMILQPDRDRHPERDDSFVELIPELKTWIRANNVDLLLWLRDKQLHWMSLEMEMDGLERPGSNWDSITAEDVVKKFANLPRGPHSWVPCAGSDNRSPTEWGSYHVFRTRTGTLGLLQWSGGGSTDTGVKIRYKLVELAGKAEPPSPNKLPEARSRDDGEAKVRERTINKNLKDFPEKLDLSTPESAWAAWQRASARKDAAALSRLSWLTLDLKDSEGWWAEEQRRDPAGLAVYLKALEESKLVEVLVYREDLAEAISFLPFPPGKGRDPYSARVLGRIKGQWKNLGEDRLESLAAARESFDQKADGLWRAFILSVKDRAEGKSPTRPAAKLQPVPLGVTVDRTVYGIQSGRPCLVLLDTGDVIMPDPLKVHGDDPQGRAWLKAHDVDLVAYERTDAGQRGVAGYDMLAVKIADDRFDKIAAKEIEQAVKGLTLQPAVLMNTAEGVPVTYAFQTRRGALGVVQIGETKSKQPDRALRSFTIRYRIVSREEGRQ